MDAITLGHDVVSIVDNLALTSDSAVLKFGADNDTTLTHTDGTGLTLNSTNKLCFNDASQFVQGSSGTVLSIGATDEIDLTATAVDLNGTLDVSGASQFNGDVVLAGTTPTLTIGDAGAEDAAIIFDGNAQDFHIGLDDTADDLVIGLGSTLGTTTHMAFDEAGTVTKPLQPAFCVTEDGGGQSITNATATTVTLDSEIFDTNADFASNTFTAPVTGKYLMTAGVVLDAGSTPNTLFNSLTLQFVASNRTWQFRAAHTYTNEDDVMVHKGTCIVDMDASDTCYIDIFASRNGASGATTIYNNGTVPNTFFSGYLLG